MFSYECFLTNYARPSPESVSGPVKMQKRTQVFLPFHAIQSKIGSGQKSDENQKHLVHRTLFSVHEVLSFFQQVVSQVLPHFSRVHQHRSYHHMLLRPARYQGVAVDFLRIVGSLCENPTDRQALRSQQETTGLLPRDNIFKFRKKLIIYSGFQELGGQDSR